MGRMPATTTFSYGQRSKCADLPERLHICAYQTGQTRKNTDNKGRRMSVVIRLTPTKEERGYFSQIFFAAARMSEHSQISGKMNIY